MIKNPFLKSKTKKEVFVAIDHGLAFPNIVGLEHPLDVLKDISKEEKVDGVIASYGIYRQARNLNISLEDKTRLVLVDYNGFKLNNGVNSLSNRKIILKPEEADFINPHGYKMYLNIYDDDDELYRNCRDVEIFTTYGAKNNIGTLAEIMFFNNTNFNNPDKQNFELLKGCRIALELGVDAIKIPIPNDISIINKIYNQVKLPIYILGGDKYCVYEDFLNNVKEISKQNISGVMFGRNFWQSDNFKSTIKDIYKNVNNTQKESMIYN